MNENFIMSIPLELDMETMSLNSSIKEFIPKLKEKMFESIKNNNPISLKYARLLRFIAEQMNEDISEESSLLRPGRLVRCINGTPCTIAVVPTVPMDIVPDSVLGYYHESVFTPIQGSVCEITGCLIFHMEQYVEHIHEYKWAIKLPDGDFVFINVVVNV